MKNDTSEQQVSGQHNDFERSVERTSWNQVTKNNIDVKIRRDLDNAVSTV